MTRADKNLTNSATNRLGGPLHRSAIEGCVQVEMELGGRVSFCEQPTNSLHRHSFSEICLVVRGRGEFRHDQARYSLAAGDVFVSEPNILHEISSYDTRDLEIFFVRISLMRIPEMGWDGGSASRFVRHHATHSAGHTELRSYVELLEWDGGRRAELMGLFGTALFDALSGPEIHRETPAGAGEFEALSAYIDANLSRRITLAELAAVYGTSERTLRRRYLSATGVGLMQEVHHRRLRAAAHGLLQGLNVHEAASKIAGMDAAQFSRSFKHAFGVGPKQFQQNYVPGSFAVSTRP